MKTLKEYQNDKKQFIKLKNLNSDNVYSYFDNESSLMLLRKYYEVYTKFLFNKLTGSLRLEVSKNKIDKLIELKGQGSWEFAGMVDMYKKGGGTCELGHPLRYVYLARNIENNTILNFGYRCVSDFFDLDENGLKALLKVKDDMFIELKDMVAIKELNLLSEHYKYDCKELGVLIQGLGVEGLIKLKDLNPLMPIVIDFVKLGLPIPNSLIMEVLKFSSSIKENLENPEFIGIDKRIQDLKNSEITLISRMFETSEKDVILNLMRYKNEQSDFFNFRNIYDINVAVAIWLNRNDRLLKAHSYFVKMGITSSWYDIYTYMVKNRVKDEDIQLYLATNILMLYSKNINIDMNFFVPAVYKYKGYELNVKAQNDFDSLIDYMATRDFFMVIKEVQENLDAIKRKEEEEANKIANMISYLESHLRDDKYQTIRSIGGVIDIICNKKIPYNDMSVKQQNYVTNTYNIMLQIDKQSEQADNQELEEINNRYTLIEKTDILAKIQRLQAEVPELPDFYKNILSTVMKYKVVSDKQIIQINNAFSKYILGKEESTVKENVILSQNKLDNKKYNLLDRPDIKDKILDLQRHPDYTNMPDGVKNILSNILKYNSASEAQIRSVENVYNRYFRGR